MSLVAEVTTPVEVFAAGRAFAASPVESLELERVVPTDTSVVPFLWAWGDGLDAFEARLAADSGVDGVRPTEETDDGRLYRIGWVNEQSSAIRKLFEHEFALLSGVCTDDGWTFEIRFPSSDDAAAFRRQLASSDVPFHLTRVTEDATVARDRSYGLTADQREILAVAAEKGYFEEPRRAGLADVAAALDISVSAASGRLRRAHAALVGNTLLSDAPTTAPSASGGSDAP